MPLHQPRENASPANVPPLPPSENPHTLKSRARRQRIKQAQLQVRNYLKIAIQIKLMLTRDL